MIGILFIDGDNQLCAQKSRAILGGKILMPAFGAINLDTVEQKTWMVAEILCEIVIAFRLGLGIDCPVIYKSRDFEHVRLRTESHPLVVYLEVALVRIVRAFSYDFPPAKI